MNEKELKELIKKGESEKIEFKESLSVKDEIGECISAFSNTKGGLIIVGVGDDKEVKGLELGKKTIEGLANFIKQNTDNHVYPGLLAEKFKDKNLLLINIKEASEKPIFFKERAYKRIGKSCHKISSSELKALVKLSSKFYWDEHICKNARLSDISDKKIKTYLLQREKHRNISKEIKTSLKTFLENIKATSYNHPTNAGILFFGKEVLKFIPQSQLRLALIKGREVTGLILDRADCEGTLFEMIKQAEEFLRKNIRFLGIRGGKSFQREDRFVVPIEALRELIINALIHRDYETGADVRVFIFDDRIEIINPGNFPEGVTPKKPKHKPVNPLLSSYMYDMGFVEKYGSGILKVRELLKENGNREQEYVLNEIETITKIYLENKKDKTSDKTVERTVERTVEKIIQLIKDNPYIIQEEIAEKLGLSRRGVEWNIQQLKQKGLIKRVGADKGGKWEVLDE